MAVSSASSARGAKEVPQAFRLAKSRCSSSPASRRFLRGVRSELLGASEAGIRCASCYGSGADDTPSDLSLRPESGGHLPLFAVCENRHGGIHCLHVNG